MKRVTGGKKKTTRTKRSPSKRAADRHQVAALPFRKTPDGAVEVLLITSLDTGRFIIPKGWPMKKLADPDAAAKEAVEEAGVVGKVRRKPLGDYSYWKRLARTCELVTVDVYPLKVSGQKENWREKGARQAFWLTPDKGWLLVDEPGLAHIIQTFAP